MGISTGLSSSIHLPQYEQVPLLVRPLLPHNNFPTNPPFAPQNLSLPNTMSNFDDNFVEKGTLTIDPHGHLIFRGAANEGTPVKATDIAKEQSDSEYIYWDIPPGYFWFERASDMLNEQAANNNE